MKKPHSLLQQIAGVMALAGLLCSALLLSWNGLARTNFFYPLWHHTLEIEAHIQEYAPQNYYNREDFAQTTSLEHQRLFALIVHGIHGRTDMAAIEYQDSKATPLNTLLRPEEVGHLEDVATIVQKLRRAGVIVLVVTVGGLCWLRYCGGNLPRPKNVLLGIAGGSGALTVAVLVLGPVRVFYQLHEWFFPPDNPWFFYYQESLMTTLMKAPDIFGAIAVLWALSALLLFIFFYAVVWHWLSGKRNRA
ncbi:DUF1461 domain-containing protein [Desulfurispira natronophila]|uniref:DUF1461 domain-containing protein n=1 Tax=Desulfurispira natronophila TaxID=682562 RepID=A0A7W8DGJ0_9BACT|nr:DUF1461 domain-containing protein [Desulfurispira natronophila]MBB5021450.1 hypothetical protein [Desulfurispira natronophila]